MPTWLLYVLTVLACWRATRLVTIDEWPPAAWLREKVGGRKPDGWADYLIHCPYCVSVWMAAGITLTLDLITGIPAPVLWWAATAGASALIQEALDA